MRRHPRLGRPSLEVTRWILRAGGGRSRKIAGLISRRLAHFQRLARLIALEAEAEKQEDLRAMQRHASGGAEASGNCLVNLVIRDEDAGLGGSVLLTLAKRNQNLSLPWTRLGTGSPVIFSAEGPAGSTAPSTGWRGIVSRLRADPSR